MYFFVLCVLTFNLPTKIFAKELEAFYNVELGNINIGSLKWIINMEGNNYNTSMFLNDKGLLSGLYSFSGEYLSEGKYLKGEFVSSRYKQFWKTKKKTKEIEILFDDMLVYSLVQKPKENENPRIDYFKTKGLVDPLTSFLNILESSTNNYKTIDGRRLYKMLLNFEKKEGDIVSKKIIITDYINIWTDHKKKDIKFITTKQDLSKKDNFFPYNIKIKNKGLVFTLTKI